MPEKITTATSANGETVKILEQKNGRLKLETNLDWTDIIILK